MFTGARTFIGPWELRAKTASIHQGYSSWEVTLRHRDDPEDMPSRVLGAGEGTIDVTGWGYAAGFYAGVERALGALNTERHELARELALTKDSDERRRGQGDALRGVLRSALERDFGTHQAQAAQEYIRCLLRENGIDVEDRS